MLSVTLHGVMNTPPRVFTVTATLNTFFEVDRQREPETDPDLWTTRFIGSQNRMPDETNGINNAVSCYKEAVQFSTSFVMTLFASF